MEDGKYMNMTIGKGPALGVLGVLLFGWAIVYFDQVILGYVVACLALSAFFAVVGFDIGVPKRTATASPRDASERPDGVQSEETKVA